MDESGAESPIELDEELLARVKPELQPGERLLWATRPVARSQPYGGCFLVAILGSALLLAAGTPAAGHVLFDPLGDIKGIIGFGLIAFVLGIMVAVILVITRFERRFARARMANAVYALTDRRAIMWMPVIGAAKGITVFSLPRGKLGNLHRVEYPDGTGDLRFGLGQSSGENDEWEPYQMEGVADVRRVEDQFRRVLCDNGPDV